MEGKQNGQAYKARKAEVGIRPTSYGLWGALTPPPVVCGARALAQIDCWPADDHWWPWCSLYPSWFCVIMPSCTLVVAGLA